MRAPSRRSVLGHIALAGITASLARPAKGATYDPVFEAIEAHRKARADVRAACAEADRLCDLADRIVGKPEVILPDLSIARCYSEIEAYFPGDETRTFGQLTLGSSTSGVRPEMRYMARHRRSGKRSGRDRMRRYRCPGGGCADHPSGSSRPAGLPRGSPSGGPGVVLRSAYRAVARKPRRGRGEAEFITQ